MQVEEVFEVNQTAIILHLYDVFEVPVVEEQPLVFVNVDDVVADEEHSPHEGSEIQLLYRLLVPL